jgi:hypothetical protein
VLKLELASLIFSLNYLYNKNEWRIFLNQNDWICGYLLLVNKSFSIKTFEIFQQLQNLYLKYWVLDYVHFHFFFIEFMNRFVISKPFNKINRNSKVLPLWYYKIAISIQLISLNGLAFW